MIFSPSDLFDTGPLMTLPQHSFSLLLFHLVATARSRSVAFVLWNDAGRSLKRTTASMSPSLSPSEPSKGRTWEIEDKFAVVDEATSRIETKLVELGFVQQRTVTFTDWYFDCNATVTNSASSFPLVRQDHWLRYRQTTDNGMWQLKRGSKVGGPGPQKGDVDAQTNSSKVESKAGADDGSTTVYEEVEGDDALIQAVSSIHHLAKNKKHGDTALSLPLDAVHPTLTDPVPWTRANQDLLLQYDLMPFAKFKTTRTSWVRHCASSSMDNGGATNHEMKVDIDRMDGGYVVGEVEICVQDENSIADARSQVRLVKSLLIGSDSCGTNAGAKLEHYLRLHNPAVLQLCKEYGVL